MSATEDSVPQLAAAIRSLINSKPSSPTQAEIEQVIRDHVHEQLQLVMGGQLVFDQPATTVGQPIAPAGSVWVSGGAGDPNWQVVNTNAVSGPILQQGLVKQNSFNNNLMNQQLTQQAKNLFPGFLANLNYK